MFMRINTDPEFLEERAHHAMFVEDMGKEICDCGHCSEDMPMFLHAKCCSSPIMVVFSYKGVLFVNCMMCGKMVAQYVVATREPEVICQN